MTSYIFFFEKAGPYLEKKNPISLAYSPSISSIRPINSIFRSVSAIMATSQRKRKLAQIAVKRALKPQRRWLRSSIDSEVCRISSLLPSHLCCIPSDLRRSLWAQHESGHSTLSLDPELSRGRRGLAVTSCGRRGIPAATFRDGNLHVPLPRAWADGSSSQSPPPRTLPFKRPLYLVSGACFPYWDPMLAILYQNLLPQWA